MIIMVLCEVFPLPEVRLFRLVSKLPHLGWAQGVEKWREGDTSPPFYDVEFGRSQFTISLEGE
jgi:hypothetical protein